MIPNLILVANFALYDQQQGLNEWNRKEKVLGFTGFYWVFTGFH